MLGPVFDGVCKKLLEGLEGLFVPRMFFALDEQQNFLRSCLELKTLQISNDSLEKVRSYSSFVFYDREGARV